MKASSSQPHHRSAPASANLMNVLSEINLEPCHESDTKSGGRRMWRYSYIGRWRRGHPSLHYSPTPASRNTEKPGVVKSPSAGRKTTDQKSNYSSEGRWPSAMIMIVQVY